MRRAVVVFALALATAAAGCTGSSRAASSHSAPSLASARALLVRHAAAVRDRDQRAFLADLDTAGAARPYFDEQRTEFANLAQVPLARWNYTVVGAIPDAAPNQAAAQRYGAKVLLLHVTLGYELRGIDRLPDTHDQYLVFVVRDGHTRLAGDDALAAQNTPSWLGPWDYGPLVAARSRASLVLGPPADRAELPTLATATDAAITAVTNVWGRHWAQRVAVLVPTSVPEFDALTGSGITDVSAAAVTNGIDPATNQAYGQRLLLNPTQLDRLSPLGRQIVLRHEITHLATAAATAAITPRWLVEGFAEYVANLDSGQSVRTAASELRQAVAAGHVPTQLPGGTAFDATASALAQVYEQSWLACRLIASRAGQVGLVRFYRAVGAALEPAAPALADAFRTVLHETQASFTTQWRAYLQAQLR